MGWRDAWEQVTHGGKNHAGLAEFRTNAGDVVQEGGVRADDEHASGSQLFAMGVEQIRHSTSSTRMTSAPVAVGGHAGRRETGSQRHLGLVEGGEVKAQAFLVYPYRVP